MSSDPSKKRWLVKDADGRVRGPFYTDDILKRIKNGEFSGEEFISLYPSANWSPISNDPTFYDKLLEILEGAPIDDEPGPVIIRSEDIADDFVQSKPNASKKTEPSKTLKDSDATPPPRSGQDTTPSKSETKNRAHRVELKRAEGSGAEKSRDIELRPRKKVLKKSY